MVRVTGNLYYRYGRNLRCEVFRFALIPEFFIEPVMGSQCSFLEIFEVFGHLKASKWSQLHGF